MEKIRTRADARREIIQAANVHAVNTRAKRFKWGVNGRCLPCPVEAPYTSRRLQQAVKVVRHHRLVNPGVLELAGFREGRR